MVFKDTNIGQLILDVIHDGKLTKTASSGYNVGEAKRVSCELTKVASLPIQAEAYQSIQGMLKVASKCITDLCGVIEESKSQSSMLEKTAEVRCLIDQMIDEGVINPGYAQEKIAELMSKDAKQLEIIKEAMKMVSKNDGNVFFETDKTASMPSGKDGMFDGVIGH